MIATAMPHVEVCEPSKNDLKTDLRWPEVPGKSRATAGNEVTQISDGVPFGRVYSSQRVMLQEADKRIIMAARLKYLKMN